jgi:hypothetical protein
MITRTASKLLKPRLLTLLLLPLLAACGTPETQSTPTPVEATATVEVVAPTATAAIEATPLPTGTTGQPQATETVPGATPVPTRGSNEPNPSPPPADTTNPFPKIIGPTPAPAGWSVAPCEGQAPLLCVQKSTENVGYVHLSTFPLSTMSEFEGMLRDTGLDANSLNLKDPEQAAKVRTALRAFVENYHKIFMEDRGATFGGTKTYQRLETKEINIGELPGLQYGFVVLNADGGVHERWLSHSAFDGKGLFTLVSSYYPGQPDAPFAFRSDAELQEFAPFLPEIMRGLKMPHPEVQGDKTRG